MTENVSELETGDPLHNEAAKWFVRVNTREPDAEELIDWQRWLMADEAHRRAFAKFEELWQTIGQTEQHSVVSAGSGDASPAIPRQLKRRGWPLALAATVLVAIVGTLWLLPVKNPSSQLPASAVAETRTAEKRTYSLPDGSRVDVGASTRILVDFSDVSRSVIIESGEAYFQVAHDRTRPFVVHAGSSTITAVGTAFNVHRALGRVAVTVAEGAVNVQKFAEKSSEVTSSAPQAQPTASAQPIIVRAGEGIQLDGSTKFVAAVDARIATAWRDGHLKFVREPLAYVVADVQRYSDVQISIADPTVAELLYTGTVIPSDVDDWLVLLTHAFPVDAQRINKRTVLLKLRGEQKPSV